MKKNIVNVRGVIVGEGIPKICVPIVGKTSEEIREAAKALSKTPADVAEWRMDWFSGVSDIGAVNAVLEELRQILGNMPILATFRTSKEGGEKAISPEEYTGLYKEIVKGQRADLIDIELFMGDDVVVDLVTCAKEAGVKTVISSHDFQKTPEQAEILSRLRKMQELGGDIPKIAVMPTCPKDVLTLLAATEEMSSRFADRPIITMSMAGTGAVSRLAGEVFGSALTFGAAGKASAPGQIEVEELSRVLQLLHKGL